MSRKNLIVGLSAIIAIMTIAIATRQSVAHPSAAPASQLASDVAVCTWLGCKTAAVSYTQDDAGNIGGANSCRAQLEAAGFRGTFYYDGNTTQPWMSVFSAAGHEVGSHLVNHNQNCTMPPSCFPNCTQQSLWQTPYTAADVIAFRQNQIEPNISAIEAGTGKPVISMAYPCGSTDAARMTAAQSYFVGARGYYDPYDSNFPWIYDVNPQTPAEYMNLNADTYFSQALVDRAINQGAWEIVTIHDYCEGINYLSARRSSLWVAPVGDILKYTRVRNATQLSNYARVGQTISFDAVHTLSTLQRQKVDGTQLTPIVYDNPVTLRVRILDTDQVQGVQVNGVAAAFTIQTIGGIPYVLIDTPVNFSRHVVITLGSGTTGTSTPVATSTNTPLPAATATGTIIPPTPTNTPLPPTATNTSLPPTATNTSVPAGCPCSLWNDTVVPAVASVGDTDAVELGVQFRANVDGYITGLRFYKGSTNTGSHIGRLWTSSGALLATATFANETASGWQTVYLSNPVAVTANSTYVASYQTTVGHFAVNRSYFTTAFSNGPLRAMSNSEVTPGNGVYVYPNGFPNQSYDASNYWVDVVFDTFAPAATSTPTATNTAVPSATSTNTPVPPTVTNTPLPTATNTATPTATSTNTPLPPTATSTSTPTPGNTGFAAPTANLVQTGGDNNGYEGSPTNAYSSNSVYATDTNSGTTTSTACTDTGKDRHTFYAYNLNVPTGRSILGIEVQLTSRVDSTTGTPRTCVQLSWDGGVTWTTTRTTATLSTTRRVDTLGGTADTWGRIWSTNDLSNANFRVRVINVASSTARDFSLDAIAVRVTYQ